MLSERISEMTEAQPRMSPVNRGSPGIPLTAVPHKPFHRPGFPVEYPAVPSPTNCQPYATSSDHPGFAPSPTSRPSYAPSPVDRQSYPTSPSSPCSTTSEHDSSLEKQMPTDSDHSDDGEKESYSRTEYYRNPSTDSNDGSVLDNGVRRYRTAFTKEQINTLEREFNKENYVSRPKRCELAKQLNLPESTIKVWFQNRRMKDKRQRMAVTWPYGIPPDPQIYAYLAAAAASYPYALPNPATMPYSGLSLPGLYSSASSAFSPLNSQQGHLKPRMDALSAYPNPLHPSAAPTMDRLSPTSSAPSIDTGLNISHRLKDDHTNLNGLSGSKSCPCGLPSCSLSTTYQTTGIHPSFPTPLHTGLHPALGSSLTSSIAGLLPSSYPSMLYKPEVKH